MAGRMDWSPAGRGRMMVGLGAIGLVAISAWFTMESGKFRTLTFVLLAFFALRTVLGGLRSR